MFLFILLLSLLVDYHMIQILNDIKLIFGVISHGGGFRKIELNCIYVKN